MSLPWKFCSLQSLSLFLFQCSTWHKKCSSQKKPNNTHSVIAMDILFTPVSFCQKPKILIFNTLKVGQRVLFRKDMVTILSYLSSFLLGIVDLIKTGPVEELLSWQQRNRCHFVSFVLNISGAKFEKHLFNFSRDILYSVFYNFSCKHYEVITFLICITQKHQYL